MTMNRILDRIKKYYREFRGRYGILGIIAVAAVFVKMILFYAFIGTITNPVPVLLVSCVLIYLLFASMKNKWIPAGIFAVISVLMVCDVTYASFFNRYLSVGMLAAAAFIGDITASILTVFRVYFLLLLVDVILIFVCLFRKSKADKPGKNKKTQSTEAQNAEDSAEGDVKIYGAEPAEDRGARSPVIPRRLRKNRKKNTFTAWVKLHIKQLAAVLIILIAVFNITGSNFLKSLSNQEIITYHIKDIVYEAFGMAKANNMSAFEDTYKNEKNGPLFGVAAGRNLIVIQLESFQNFVIGRTYNGQEITPNLNKLLDENTAYFDHYYQQIGSGNTSDAEFATNNSIYGALMSYTYKLYGDKNYFRGLPVMLKEKGYETAVFHAFERKNFWSRETAYPNLGFDRYYGGLTNRPGDGVYKMEEWMGWGLTDTYFYAQTADFLTELPQPFYSFLISLSNHHPYKMLEHYQFIKLLPEDKGTIVGDYLNSAAYTDYALGQFLDELKDKGLYDNSIIAIYGDHVGLVKSDEIDASMERLLGRLYEYDVMMNIPLIITVPNAGKDIKQTISTAGGQLDFFPTIAYLLGFDKLNTLYLGHNLFSVKEGLVVEQTYMTKGSFFKNDMAFEMARDGVFEHGRAWNLTTRAEIPLNECYDDYVKSMEIINTAEYILRSDAIRKIYLHGEDATTAFSAAVSRPYPDVIAIAGAPGEERGNSIKDIAYSYEQNNRFIRIEMQWTEKRADGETDPVAKNSAGETVMTYEELIDWMEHHADTGVVVSIEKSGDYFLKFMAEQSPAIADRFIMELPQLAEYTGKHDSIINISDVPQSVSEIRDYIERNHVWAVIMTKEESEGKFASLMDMDTGIYAIGDPDGFITKIN